MLSIGIVGGGVIGLGTAQAILEDIPNVSVTVYADKFTPNTTADISAGFIFPFLFGKHNNEDDIIRWTLETIEHFKKVARENPDFSKGLEPLSGYSLFKEGPIVLTRVIQECFDGVRIVGPEEIQKFTQNKYTGGIFFTTWSVNPPAYLQCTMRKLKEKGVRFVKRKVYALNEIAAEGHDIVINCTGFGAKSITDDKDLVPIQGQVISVNAPWIKQFCIEEDGDSYVLPRCGIVIVGGTHEHDTSLEVNDHVAKKIWSGACQLLPSLKSATVIGHHVGLRPGRSKIRMEIELVQDYTGRKYPVLHHYGHGGSGVTLHWGCAKAASALLQKFIAKSSSKL